jgi:hypothetical protein
MKRSTKFIATAAAAVALFLTTNANAQSNLGIGITAGAPTSNSQTVVLGADLRLQINVSKRFSIPLSGGYTRMVAADGMTGKYAIDHDYIPVKGGVKYFFSSRGTAWYAEMSAGAGFATGDYPTTETEFLLSPALGYSFGSGIDLSTRYEGFSEDNQNRGFFGVRLAYGFKLGK